MNLKNSKFMQEESRFTGRFEQSVYRSIIMSAYPYRYGFFSALIFGFIGRALILANTNIIGKWIDTICLQEGHCLAHKNSIFSNLTNSQFLWLLILMCTLGFFCVLFFRIRVARLGTLSSASFYDEASMRSLRFPMSFFDTTPVGRIITRFSSDYNSIFRMTGGPLAEFISITFDLILYVVLTLLASPFFAPIMIFSILSNAIVYKINQKKMRTERREHSLIRSSPISHFAETAQANKIIRLYAKTKIFTKYFLIKMDKYIQQKNKINIIVSIFSFEMALVNIFMIILTACYGIFLISYGIVTVGALGVALTFISMTSTTIQVFFEWVSSIEDALTGCERLNEYIQSPLEQGATLPISSQFKTNHLRYDFQADLNNKILSVPNAHLNVENLCLRYQPQLPRALDAISFQVKAGEKIGIIGKTGSGKSSLIQALFHLYPFEAGRIQINNYEAALDGVIDLKKGKIHLESFRSAISLISQDPTLFIGSLRDNLLASKTHTDAEILHLVRLVGLGYLVENNSLDLQIEEKGSNLSAGERQLICIVRCLLRNSPIVLMDEATSAIDPQSEALIIKATELYLSQKTQIIIAHRLSTIRNCHRVIWLDSGKIIMNDKTDLVLLEFVKQLKDHML